MSDKNILFSNRFQATLFDDYVSLEFAFIMNTFSTSGNVSPEHQIQRSQYVVMTPSDAKELAIILTDLILRVEEEKGAQIVIREPFKTIWESRIKKQE